MKRNIAYKADGTEETGKKIIDALMGSLLENKSKRQTTGSKDYRSRKLEDAISTI